MDSFQVKIDWEWPRKRENKRNRSEEFLPYKQQKIKKKKAKKLKKLKKKKHYGFFTSKNELGKAEKEKN